MQEMQQHLTALIKMSISRNTKFSELEKVTIADISQVICENKKCEIRGYYWRCYFEESRNKCEVYQNYLIRRNRNI